MFRTLRHRNHQLFFAGQNFSVIGTWGCRIVAAIAFLAMLPLCSCAVFSCRHHSWEKKVTRSATGVLSFAQPRTYGTGAGNALLLVHGFGDGPHVWQELAPLLAAQGYTVRAMRLPGWCEPMDAKLTVTCDQWRAAIVSELERLRQTHDRVAVLAHSMGGCLVTVLAQQQLLPADALVLYAPMFEVSSARSPLLKTATWFKLADAFLPDSMIIENTFDEHVRRSAPRPATERDPFCPKHIFSLLYAEMEQFESQQPVLDIPLRLVVPGEDRVVETRRSLRWFEQLKAPDKTLHISKPAGHVLPLDMNKAEEVDRLVIWLARFCKAENDN